ncbi:MULTISPECIES: hypothetical protein [Bacillus]|uniref:hypothetical protein n=1 Tax=Bacillus TaxID=1386 RepID=UPI0005352FAC|nr:hypothetical protein [Bacillus pseudomycoides]MED1597516.1 hypothetical protein [Bacillus pseudomycoides]MED4714624.1 hypothetical protein [Bacillus pseudomycoides]OOR48458.1 hypothetical protein BLX05_29385 [Bacillus pseudomycoides]PDY08019.1 hypothetical protein COO16_31065 [Bacillus pseudomycoides]PEU34738.1 hypothetical protein CN535_24555 [Bacillus pseudomycoides]
MTCCTNCKRRWNALQVWSLFFKREGKDCPYCLQTQYLSADTLRQFSGTRLLNVDPLFLWIFPVFATLSEKDETYNVLFKDKSNEK